MVTAFVSSFTTTFRPALSRPAVSSAPAVSRSAVTMRASPSIPFLECPPKLDGSRVGDYGFDPLYLSNYIDLDNAAAAEIKHGRICMLAALGMLVQEFVHLPNAAYSEPNPLTAIYTVPVEAWLQIIGFISLIELITFDATYTSGADFGFDPMGMGKGKDLDELKLKELKNGRLAMMAVMGFIMQTIVTGKPIIAQLGSLGSAYNFDF